MTSGLIYIAIIGMWIAYFAPRWIHDRNELSGKSVERYKSALRVVANQSMNTDVNHDNYAVAKSTQMRRRLIFTVIILSLITTIVGGAMGTMSFLYLLIPVSGLLIYIVGVRHHMNTEQIQKRRVVQLNRQASGISSTNLADVVHPRPSTEHWIPLSERELKGVVILPKGSAEVRNSWQPTDVPIPTYVNAPKAVTPKRVIDLTNPGQWSQEQDRLEREALAAASPSRDEIFDQQLADETVERLKQARAVNQ